MDAIAPFDILFSFDTTGSMSRAIEEVKGRIGDMISRLKSDIPFIKIGVIAHGDYCDKDVFYLEQHVDFSSDIVELQNFVNGIEGTGGGDPEECYEYILRVARQLSWTPGSQRALVVIGDSVPHEPEYELNTDNLDWRVEAGALMEMGVKIYGVQAFEEVESSAFFEELVSITNGQHIKLSEFSNICDMILAICYREKGAEFLEGYEAEVRAREAARGPALHKDLEGMFGALRRGDSNASGTGSLVRGLSAGGATSPVALVNRPSLISPIGSHSTSIASINPGPPLPIRPVPLGAITLPLPSTSALPGSIIAPAFSDVSYDGSASSDSGLSSDVEMDDIAKDTKKARKGGIKKHSKAKEVKAGGETKKGVIVKKQGVKDIVKSEAKYRHLVSNKKFVLGGETMKHRWTNWKLVMTKFEHDLPSPRIPRATRRIPDRPGFKKEKLFPNDAPGQKAIYELAVQKAKRASLKKYVMFSKVCRINDWSKWERSLFSKPWVRKQVDHVIQNGGLVWVRRCKLAGMGKNQRELVSQYKSGGLYKYAWNERTAMRKPGKLSWAMDTC